MLEKIRAQKTLITVLCLVVTLAITVVAGMDFYQFRNYQELIIPGEGVTGNFMLSEYLPALEGTYGDTTVYVMEGKTEGPSMLVLGGTHPNEPSGHMAAIALVEHCKVDSGTLYVIPRANNSAFTHNDAQEASPHFYHLQTASGNRAFVFGSRATNPLDQWPDPDVYTHQPSGQSLSGSETRNLNRGYPGVANGNMTERVCYAITELIKDKGINITVDLHESSPEYPTINAMVAHESAMELASNALLDMMLDGVQISLEPSPATLHGLTHRELGDHTDTLPVLMETANPSHGRLRGATNEELVLTGKDPYYLKAAENGYVWVPYDENGVSIEERVARHLTGIHYLCEEYGTLYGEKLSIVGIPSYDELLNGSLSDYLN